MEAFEKKVRDSFGRQPFMSTLGAEMTSVGRGRVEIRFPFDSKLTQQKRTRTRVRSRHHGFGLWLCGFERRPEEADVPSVEFKVNLLARELAKYSSCASVKRAGFAVCIC